MIYMKFESPIITAVTGSSVTYRYNFREGLYTTRACRCILIIAITLTHFLLSDLVLLHKVSFQKFVNLAPL